MTRPALNRPDSQWRRRLHGVIFEAETPAGKAFDVVLIWSIVCSVAAAVLESVSSIRAAYGSLLYGVEWCFTILFTVEYGLRLLSLTQPWRYITSSLNLSEFVAGRNGQTM
jgi:voltage-gated potassium channel